MLAERKKRLFELYEDGHIAREEFQEQKDILNMQIQRLEEGSRYREPYHKRRGDRSLSYGGRKRCHDFFGRCE